MSHMVTRKGPVGDDKEKRQTDSPVKEMKKKLAANAEKEKLAAEKTVDKATADKQNEKTAEKVAEKKDKSTDKSEKSVDKKDKAAEKKDKTAEKKEKSSDKSVEKKDKTSDKTVENQADKKDRTVEKNIEKPAEKVAPTEKKEKAVEKKEAAEKSKDEGTSTEKNEKKENVEEKVRKPDTTKQNGEATRTQNGEEVTNGGASGSDDEELVIVEQENDEMFPELTYDDNSDVDGFDDAPSRSLTRRSQSKEPKLLKLKEDLSDRRLRSAGSPKPTEKKQEKDSPKKSDQKKIDTIPEVKQPETEEKQGKVQEKETVEMEVVIEADNSEECEATRRDTKFSRSRVKVSPYRRSARLADTAPAAAALSNTTLASSTLANYTGNNTTMEMDITESSILSEDPSSLEDSYLSGLRSIRGRRSYKPLKQMTLRNIAVNSSMHSVTSLSARESGARPTGTVVGRKRRPDAVPRDGEPVEAEAPEGDAPKRPRLLDRLARPFRTHSTPLPARRAAEIVGINTDLPLTAPVAAAESFDPETIKPATAPPAPLPAPSPPADRDSKRCVVM
ncbi:uncharacterized protein [Battus philenor]|uniref:uncharacterized protein isoform X2 n=1 Tax=Battus philenor TaxID=42288 RepID=UPI0035CEC55B